MGEIPRQTQLLQIVEEFAMPFLEIGRGSFNVPHTKAVVFYAQQIARAQGLDEEVLSVAAWLHDIGYADLDSKRTLNEKKSIHMIKGGGLARRFMDRPEIATLLTPKQRARIIHLVSLHDSLEVLKDPDEIAIEEADTLGFLNLNLLTPTNPYKEGMTFIAHVVEVRGLLFKSKFAKRELLYLLPSYLEFFKLKNPDQYASDIIKLKPYLEKLGIETS